MLLRWRVVGTLLNLLIHVLWVLLSAVVHEVALLTSHGVIVRVNARLGAHHGGDDWLHVVLDLLLLVHVLWSDWWSGELLLHAGVQIHALELLSGLLNTDELLLETLLLLCEVHVCGDQLGVQVGVHLFLTMFIDVDLRWRKDLLCNWVHLLRWVLVVVLRAGIVG